MNTFENWYTNILEEVATPTKSLAGDVDTIISSLGTLVKELTEELNGPEFTEVNEADAEGPSKVWQWIWWMPKARKAQQKVNKIKLNVTDMEAAAGDAPDKEQKAKINAKATIARDQAGELQKMVDDKYGAKGDLVKRALHSEKIAGQIASIKRATGLEDDPEKVASYKEKMAELQGKYKEDQEAIKELEPSDEDKQAEKEKQAQKIKDDKEAAGKQDKLNADAEAAKTGKKDGDDKNPPATDDKNPPATDDKNPPATDDKNPPATDDKNPPATDDDTTPTETDAEKAAKAQKITDKTAEIETLKSDLAAENAKETKDDAKISGIEGKIQTANQELDALKNPPAPAPAEESLVIRAKAAGLNELASEIASKFDWQVSEGTVLHQNYDAIIKKAEYSNTLNESRYQNLSVKDRFSRLL
jgi:hypothetical protein